MYIKTEEYEIPERIIPATTGKRKVYYAEDGTCFNDDERVCRIYEEKRKYEMIRVLKTEISGNPNCKELEEEYSAKFYYIKDLNDLQDLVDNRKLKIYFNCSNLGLYTNVIVNADKIDTKYCDFTLYGEGWYIIWQNCGGDWDDEYYCKEWNHYIAEHEKRVTDYKIAVTKMLQEKEQTL